MAASQRITFARINRRTPDQSELTDRSFAMDFTALAESRQTKATQPALGPRPERTWVAADLNLVASHYMTGTLGYYEHQTLIDFDNDAWSWLKGSTMHTESGSDKTVVPFAIDLREDRRFIAFAPAPRLLASQFASGLQRVLQSAVNREGTMAANWEVDLITFAEDVESWINLHPKVFFIRRTIKFTNPGRSLDSARSQMRDLGSRRRTEVDAAPRNRILNTDSHTFRELLEGVETGDIDILLKSRGEAVGSEERF